MGRLSEGENMDLKLREALKDSVFDGRQNIDHGLTKNELEWHHRDRRTAAFKKATGLIESGAYRRAGIPHNVYSEMHNSEFDHTSLWRDGEGRYILTTEPYDGGGRIGNVSKCLAWCERNNVVALRSKWPGMWYPWGKGQGSILILVSTPKNGGDIHVVERCLLASFSERQ